LSVEFKFYLVVEFDRVAIIKSICKSALCQSGNGFKRDFARSYPYTRLVAGGLDGI